MPKLSSYQRAVIDLLRWNKPVGAWLLYCPCVWGVAAGSAHGAAERPLSVLVLLALGAWVMRSAGCIINDIADRELDAQVERTRNRPLASGRLSVAQALRWLAIMLLCGLAVALALPQAALYTALAALPLVALYPLAKRWLAVPQYWLGVVFAWGVPTGYAAVADDVRWDFLWLYGAAVAYTIGYDTLYAAVDAPDDARAGVNSSVLSWGPQTRRNVGVCFLLTCGLIVGYGLSAAVAGWPFYLLLSLGCYKLMRAAADFNPASPDTNALNKQAVTALWLTSAIIVA